MANETQQVVIEFIADTSQLAPATDQLEKLGTIDKATAASFKATNAELAKRDAVLKATAASTKAATDATKKSIGDVDSAVNKLTKDFIDGFSEGVTDALKEAGVSAEQFSEAIKSGGTEIDQATTSIRQRLREITQELALMKANGEDATNPERYQALIAEAGNLKDAFGDVNEEIARAGSDTGALDSLIQVSQGVAGGFALAQGAAALFGDESEDLQEVLLKVNASMAILQGFQQLQALYAARAAVAIGVESVATTALTAAQTAYNFVVGTSIGLMRAFRIALAATGIGLFIILIAELVSLFQDEEDQLKAVNRELERNKNIIDADSAAIRDLTDEYVAQAEARNVLESELIRLRGRGLQQEIAVLQASNERLTAQRDALDATTDAWQLLNKQVEDNNTAITGLTAKTRTEAINLQKTLAEESLRSTVATTERAIAIAAEGSAAQLELQKKLVRDKLELELQTQALTETERLKIIQDANQQQLELQVAFNKRRIDLDVARTEESLRGVEEGSRRELELRQELIRQQAASDLATTKLSAAEREQVRRESLNEQIRLQLAFDAEQRRIAIEQAQQVRADLLQIATERNQALLATAREGTEERLQLEIFAIELAASEARRVAGENAVEIERINAESQAQISRVKAQFRQAEAESEIRIENAKNARILRGLQTTLSDERSTFKQRTQAILDIDEIQRRAIDRQKQNLRSQFADGLITQQEYNARYAELEDERAQISEDTNRQIQEQTRAHNQALIQAGLEVAGQLVGVLDSLFQAQARQEQARTEEQRRRVDELRESGAITEKEAERRRKEIEQEDRKAQQRQAQREKQIAVFRALLAIPSAFLQGTSQGGPILGAIYAAIAAAQAAIVIAQPIPRFGKGKKDGYEGPAEVGETGSELVEKNGRMYIAKKRTVIYLGAKDKVYSPSETAKMLAGRNLQPASLPISEARHSMGANFDYEKLGEVIRRNGGISLNIDGYKNFVIQGHAFTSYLNKRRGF